MNPPVISAVPADATPHGQRAGSARIRVCHLSVTLQTGGLERLLVDFARLGDPGRFEWTFLTLDELGPPAAELRALGFPVESLALARRGKLRTLCRLRRLLRELDVDVLHTHNTLPGFYGALAAGGNRVSAVINTQHGRGCGAGWKCRLQFALANAVHDRILGVSEDSARLCRKQDWLHSGKMACIWNGIDVEKFTFRGPASVPTAISVARLSTEKDFPTLLRAVAVVARRFPEFRLRIVGGGRERSALQRLAGELGIEHCVEFLGERSDIPQLLASAGLFVSSSTTEGISLTLLEAMAVGLPVVTTTVGGNPEIVVDGVTGRLVPPQQPEQLAQAILKMLDERSLWYAMGEAARRRVESQFDIRVVIDRYQTLYQMLMQKKGRRRQPPRRSVNR